MPSKKPRIWRSFSITLSTSEYHVCECEITNVRGRKIQPWICNSLREKHDNDICVFFQNPNHDTVKNPKRRTKSGQCKIRNRKTKWNNFVFSFFCWKLEYKLQSGMRTHTHTHTHIYVSMFIYNQVSVEHEEWEKWNSQFDDLPGQQILRQTVAKPAFQTVPWREASSSGFLQP